MVTGRGSLNTPLLPLSLTNLSWPPQYPSLFLDIDHSLKVDWCCAPILLEEPIRKVCVCVGGGGGICLKTW